MCILYVYRYNFFFVSVKLVRHTSENKLFYCNCPFRAPSETIEKRTEEFRNGFRIGTFKGPTVSLNSCQTEAGPHTVY